MALSPEEEQRAITHLRLKWQRKPCPMCGGGPWIVHGHVTLSLANKAHGVVLGGRSLPCAAVVCSICGNTALVNLLIAGVIEPGSEPNQNG